MSRRSPSRVQACQGEPTRVTRPFLEGISPPKRFVIELAAPFKSSTSIAGKFNSFPLCGISELEGRSIIVESGPLWAPPAVTSDPATVPC